MRACCALLLAVAALTPAAQLFAQADPVPERTIEETRSLGGRRLLKAEGGGTDGSEAAVGHALKWLAAHQRNDGGWSFNHGSNNQHTGPVRNPGGEKSTAAATAIVLLTFLASGQTHKDGIEAYLERMQRGTYYLGRVMREEGSRTGQAWTAMALAEAHALSQDRSLAEPSKQAFQTLVDSQDREPGGWSSTKGQPCDALTSAWHAHALRSARCAKLDVPAEYATRAQQFLATLQKPGTAWYGVAAPGEDATATSACLASRIDLGGRPGDPELKAGIELLKKTGPAKDDPLYNYFATHFLFQVGGEPWKKWNAKARDLLVNSQFQTGEYTSDKGTWWTKQPPQGVDGGRLLETCLNCLTLQVYHRYPRTGAPPPK